MRNFLCINLIFKIPPTDNMTKSIFDIVAQLLDRIGRKCGLTYNEVNILVYYLLIPLSWCIMLDCFWGFPITTFILIFIWVGIFIATRHIFQEWCDLRFQESVDFLNWFNRLGGNYILNSVIICVVIPLIIYIGLTILLINS